MKLLHVALFVAVLSLTPLRAAAQEGSVFGQPGRWGLGLAATDLVSGVTAKVYLTNRVSLQGTVGFWYGYGPLAGLDVGVDALYDMPRIWGNQVAALNWYLGGGGSFVFYGPGPQGGFQAIGGVDLQFRRVPIDLAVDLRPTFLFGEPPGFNFFFGAGIAVRYFFG
jgi:hypothetical protein